MKRTVTIAIILGMLLTAASVSFAAEKATETAAVESGNNAVPLEISQDPPAFKQDAASAASETPEAESAPSDFPGKTHFIASRDANPNALQGTGSHGSLAWVVAILFLATLAGSFVLLKKRGIVMPLFTQKPKGSSGSLKIVQSLLMGPKHRLAVVDYEGKRLLLGMGGDAVTLLMTTDRPAVVEAPIPSETLETTLNDETFEEELRLADAEPTVEPQATATPQPEFEDRATMAKTIEERVRQLKRFMAH